MRDGSLHRDDRAAGGSARDGERGGIDDGVARREIRRGAYLERADVPRHPLEVGARVHEQELVIRRIARRYTRTVEAFVREVGDDRGHAVRRLRVPEAPEMIAESFVFDDDHARNAA